MPWSDDNALANTPNRTALEVGAFYWTVLAPRELCGLPWEYLHSV